MVTGITDWDEMAKFEADERYGDITSPIENKSAFFMQEPAAESFND
jgi:hypothetical protein